jgi:hypothetical protein
MADADLADLDSRFWRVSGDLACGAEDGCGGANMSEEVATLHWVFSLELKSSMSLTRGLGPVKRSVNRLIVRPRSATLGARRAVHAIHSGFVDP